MSGELSYWKGIMECTGGRAKECAGTGEVKWCVLEEGGLWSLSTKIVEHWKECKVKEGKAKYGSVKKVGGCLQ